MATDRYCRPNSAGLSSAQSAVARRLAKLIDALDSVNSAICKGDILDEVQDFRHNLRERLEAEGWICGYVDGTLDATDTCRAYPPGSPTGEKIRKWRETRLDGWGHHHPGAKGEHGP